LLLALTNVTEVCRSLVENRSDLRRRETSLCSGFIEQRLNVTASVCSNTTAHPQVVSCRSI
jgi:hypothetical protein